MDAETLRAAATLARRRASPPRHLDQRDGLERLGARRALVQLAKDLEVTAAEIERQAKRSARGGKGL